MPVQITVIKGVCQGGVHQVGDDFTVDWTTPKGMCLGAWSAIAPYVTALLCGGDVAWSEEKGVMTLHCVDPDGITLELRRSQG